MQNTQRFGHVRARACVRRPDPTASLLGFASRLRWSSGGSNPTFRIFFSGGVVSSEPKVTVFVTPPPPLPEDASSVTRCFSPLSYSLPPAPVCHTAGRMRRRQVSARLAECAARSLSAHASVTRIMRLQPPPPRGHKRPKTTSQAI